MDVDVSNKKYLARTEEFWDTIQASGWWQFDEESEKQKQTNGEWIKKVTYFFMSHAIYWRTQRETS